MIQKKSIYCVFILCLLSIPINVSAQHNHNPTAHTHGEGLMSVVYDTQQLQLEIQTPAANLLGFEHSPKTEAEWNKLSELRNILDEPTQIVSLTPKCEIAKIDIKIPFENEVSSKQNAKKDAHNDHNEHKSHSHHDDHKHTDDNETPAHQDIHITYEWRCSHTKPPAIDVHLFKQFSGFKKLNVQWVTNSQQGALTFNRSVQVPKIQL